MGAAQGRQERSSRIRWCKGKGGRQERPGWLGVKGRQECSGALFFVEGNRIGRAEGVGRSLYRVGKKDKVA